MGIADLLDRDANRQNIKISLEHIVRGILELKDMLGESQLVVIGQLPRPGATLYDVFTRPRPLMFSGFDPEQYLYAPRDALSNLEKINAQLKQAAEQTGKFIFIDPFAYLCDQAKCRNTDDARHLIYSDSGHLSTYGSLFMINALKPQLLNLLNARG